MLNASLLWFTGMSGTGKTTLLKKLNTILINKGFTTFTIDGDQHRKKQNEKISTRIQFYKIIEKS